MTLKQALTELIASWRFSSEQTRAASDDITNLIVRGHMNGIGDALEMAASDVVTLLKEHETAEDSA